MTSHPKSGSSVDRVYGQLKRMVANYEFMPDSRINESELAKELQTSRTPLREALNRLVAEGFLTFKNGHGFFCRSLKPHEIMDIYEARAAIEADIVKYAILRASDAEIAELEAFLRNSDEQYQPENSPMELVRLDEEFHMRLAALSGNAELTRLLQNVNDRIHYVRLIDLQTLSEKNGAEIVTTEPHLRIVHAIKNRDAANAEAQMRAHIERRLESITEVVRTAFANLYAP